MRKNTWKLAVLTAGAVLIMAAVTGCGKSSSESAAAGSTETSVAETTAAETETEAAKTPKVGIAWVSDFDMADIPEDVEVYLKAVEKAGGEPVLLPKVTNEQEAREALSAVGAIIMTGGEDISPSYYNEKPDAKLEEISEARDTSDFWMITEALKEDVPMLATCRGFQMLNVVCGGSLYQDIPTQYETTIAHRDPAVENFTFHNITVDDNNKLSDILGAGIKKVNSWHHQCVKELGENLQVIARADDRIVEAVEKTDNSYVLGLQFHPEWHVEDGDEEFLLFFKTLVEKAAVN